MRVRGSMETVSEIEVNVDTVYVRTNIARVEKEDFTGWEYDEVQYGVREYIENINALGQVNTDLELVTLELGQQNTDLELRILALEGK